ncbi:glutamate racemase [Halalkalibacter sp. AB-rgal2]|uniref:glutamate racemase n=1 Tax=Halalkalibacter sp. AB-rgal2 TaxID=3242695 RepID=UPI00359E6BCE
MEEEVNRLNKAIGVIDSGLGGLTVASELMRQLPKEGIIYIGDSLRCPYGPRTSEEVRKFTWEMIDQLLIKDVKLLVIACNTAAAVVLEEVKRELTIPVIGVVQPGAISALKVTNNKKISVIGTEGTISSAAYEKALLAIDSEVEVASLACTPFVPLVEQGIYDTEVAYEVVRSTLQELQNYLFDTMILGCTHYPLLKGAIQEVVGDQVVLISSGDETAREVSSILYHKGLREKSDNPVYEFYTTGDEKRFSRLASEWMGLDVRAQQIKLGSSYKLV